MSDFWNIEQLSGEDNLGGGRSFLFTDPSYIEVEEPEYKSKIYDAHQLFLGKTWFSANFTELSLGFQETESIKSGAYVKTSVLRGYVPKDDLLNHNLLLKIGKRGLVVLYKDNNGEVRQLGTRQNPAKLTMNTNHGGSGNINKIGFTITYISRDGAPFYQSELPSYHICDDPNASIQGFFALGYPDLGDLVIGTDAAGYYDTLVTDGSSDPIVFKINDVETALPFTLNAGDTLSVSRVVSASAGWYKLIQS